MVKVSVIIPTYNCARFLPDTLASVTAQDYRNRETIVVDDGSTDETEQVMRSFSSSDVIYIRQENSGGPSKPRNVGIGEACGDLIVMFDADDIMHPSRISRAVKLFEKEAGLGLVFSNFNLMEEDGTVLDGAFLNAECHTFNALKKRALGDGMYVIPHHEAFKGLFYHNYISLPVLPKDVLIQMGGFDERLKNSEDRDMWFRVTRHYDVGYLDEVGFTHRLRAGSIETAMASRNVPSRILALRKQIEAGLPAGLERQARRLVAASLYSLGYEQQRRGDLAEARRTFYSSLREQPNKAVLRGIAITLLGHRIGRVARRFLGRS